MRRVVYFCYQGAAQLSQICIVCGVQLLSTHEVGTHLNTHNVKCVQQVKGMTCHQQTQCVFYFLSAKMRLTSPRGTPRLSWVGGIVLIECYREAAVNEKHSGGFI